MKATIVLADTGRPAGPATLNLLNAGWSFTTAFPSEDGGGWVLPEQAVAVFIEVDWNQLNRALSMRLELVDDDDTAASIVGDQPAVILHELMVAPVPGAPNGTPGMAAFLASLPSGAVRVPAARRRYLWRLTIDGERVTETGFWVDQPPSLPHLAQ